MSEFDFGLPTKYEQFIGKKVTKESGRPFKSKLKVNTVKGIVEHPILKIPAYTFVEDESVVECRQCVVVEQLEIK